MTSPSNPWSSFKADIPASRFSTTASFFLYYEAPRNSGVSQIYVIYIDNIYLQRTSSIYSPIDWNLRSPLNAELELMNAAELGVPGLLAEGGKALRLDSIGSTGHDLMGLDGGLYGGLESRTIEMWFRLIIPFDPIKNGLHVLLTRGSDLRTYGLYVNASSRAVEFVIGYSSPSVKWTASLPIVGDETLPHYVAAIITTMPVAAGYDVNVTLVLDNVTTSSNNSIVNARCKIYSSPFPPPSVFAYLSFVF